jgi:hypothetical protein
VLAALLVGAAAACAPDTHVHDEGRARVGRAPDGGGAAPAEPGAAGPDLQPPALRAVTLSLAADCVRIRVEASEPVRARVRFTATADGAREERALGEGASLFDLAFRLPGLPPLADASARVTAADRAGHEAAADAPAFRVPPPPRLPLAITEVLANPAGPETSQEYVELRNLGAAPVSLAGLGIADDAARDPLPAVVLAPGAFALVVAAGFVEDDPAGAALRPGTALVRVPGRIGRDGLRQAGEVVRLVDGDGAVLSSYGGWVDTSRAAWSGHSVHRMPDQAACDHPQAWTMAPAPPTPGW